MGASSQLAVQMRDGAKQIAVIHRPQQLRHFSLSCSPARPRPLNNSAPSFLGPFTYTPTSGLRITGILS
jgi:hypothetical protein